MEADSLDGEVVQGQSSESLALGLADAMQQLNARQTRFPLEYLIDLDPRKAAIRCGYKATSAGETARNLLKNPHVRVIIRYHQARLAERTEVTIDNVVREIAAVGFARMDDFMFPDEHGQMKIDLTRAAAGRHGLTAVSAVKQDTWMENTGEVDDEGRPQFEAVKRLELKLWDKTKGLDLLMRHLGAYNDKLELNVGGGPIGAAVRMKDMSPIEATDAYMDMMQGEAPAVSDQKMAGAKLVGGGSNGDANGGINQ